MTRYHNIDGKRIKFTDEEEALRDAEEAAAATASDELVILKEITRLEILETPRRIAEAALEIPLVNEYDLTCGDGYVLSQGSTGKDWLQYNRDLIAMQRAKL